MNIIIGVILILNMNTWEQFANKYETYTKQVIRIEITIMYKERSFVINLIIYAR